MKIGFIGLGAMGNEMAQAISEAGHELYVYNRTAAKAATLCSHGAHLTSSAAECAEQSRLLFSMLYDDAALKNVLEGRQGLMAGLQRNCIHVSCSTLSVAMAQFLTEQHHAHHQHYISAPVLGRPSAAKDKKLFTLMAGEEESKAEAKKVMHHFSQKIFDIGTQPAQANLVKLSLNFMILTTIEQLGEVFTLNEKMGIDTHLLLDVMLNSFFGGAAYKNYGSLMISPPDKTTKAEASVDLGAKDIALLMQAAENSHIPLPLASLIRDRLIATQAQGMGKDDFVVLAQRARAEANLP